MWKDIAWEWQQTFEQGWIAFQNGSLPIGAIITDGDGNILIAGRNEICENHYPNRRTAHAEMYCMRNLDTKKYSSTGEYHLYTTMEPCPMCMGTIVMGGIRKIHVAAKDRYCGALHYAKYDPYMQSKKLEIYLEEGEMEAVQLAQQSYHELRSHQGQMSKVVKQFQIDCPNAIEVAMQMYSEGYLDKCVERGVPYCEVYDTICSRLYDVTGLR